MTMRAIGALLALFAFVAITAGQAWARHRPQAVMGQTVRDLPSSHYRFERFVMDSADGERRWAVDLAIPRREPPVGGFPALWMLDGNAALMVFDAELLGALARAPRPPVLVFLGYDNDLRIDTPARTHDYTWPQRADDRGRGIGRGGGADVLLASIRQRIRPAVERRISLDPHGQTLWGHSFGGLFVLYALMERAGEFSGYAAGTPSLWWADGALATQSVRRFSRAREKPPVSVLLTVGGGGDPGSASDDASAAFARRLSGAEGIELEYRVFPSLGHGPMFRASLLQALHRFAGIAERDMHSSAVEERP